MPTPSLIDLSHERLTLRLAVGAETADDILSLPNAQAWAASGPQFAVYMDNQLLDARSPGVLVDNAETITHNGARTAHIRFEYPQHHVEIVQHLVVYPATALFETWHTVRIKAQFPSNSRAL